MDCDEVGEVFRTCFVCRVEYDNSTLVDPVRFEAALKCCGLPKGTAIVGIQTRESSEKDRVSYDLLLAFPHRVRWWDVEPWMEQLGAEGRGGGADVYHWPDYRGRGEEFLREHAGDFSNASFGSLDSVRAAISEGDTQKIEDSAPEGQEGQEGIIPVVDDEVANEQGELSISLLSEG
jgi:hypothetical protein